MKNRKKNRYGSVMLGIGMTTLCISALLGVWLMATFLPPMPEGTEDVTVPQLLGEVYVGVDERLSADIYDVTVDYRTDGAAEKGTVLAQSPSAGAIRRVVPGKRRCALHLTLSAGEARVTLPDVIGQSAATAALQLQEKGLIVTREKRRSTQYSPGQVIEMRPAPGSLVRPGEAVTLVESTVATVRTLTVPDVVGLDAATAAARLRGAGLIPDATLYAPSAQPEGTVISQYPLSGTLVTAGMRATLTLSDGTLAPPPQESVEDMPRGEQGSAEDMPGSPQGGQQAPDASQYEDEISPPQADEGKKFDLFGWFS